MNLHTEYMAEQSNMPALLFSWQTVSSWIVQIDID